MNSVKRSTISFFIVFGIGALFFLATFIFVSLYDDSDTTQTPDRAMVITDMRVDVEWNNDRSCKIKQDIVVEFVTWRHGIYVDIPVNSGERVRNLNVKATDMRGHDVMYEFLHEAGNKLVAVKVGDPDDSFGIGEKLHCVLRYDYYTPEHPEGKDILDLNAIGYGWACEIENAYVSVTFPKALQKGDVTVWVGDKTSTDYSIINGGKTITLTATSLNPFNGVQIKAKMPSGTLVGSSFEGVATIVVGIVLVVAVVLLMVFVGKDKPLTPIVSFYPPMTDGKVGRRRRMLPVQLGKIVDGTCSADDVTSLIFYWASEGYLSIEEGKSDTYLIKLKDVDPVTEYERLLFNELFKSAKYSKRHDDTRIGIKDLRGKFATHIATAKSSVDSEFRGKFYDKRFTALTVLFVAAAVLFAGLGSVLCTLRIASGFYNFLGLTAVLPVAIACALGAILVRSYFKLSDVRRKVFLALFFVAVIMLSVAVMFTVPTDAMGWVEKIIFALCTALTASFAPFLTRRTDSYTELLNDTIGFRNFLRDAQKDELETLLKDDPQYYYNILPYANVLGVSKIWQDKFAALTIDPPRYYHGKNISVFDVYAVSSLSHSIGSSLSYTPSGSSGGSSSGGGHGGGGGGFGGGGGRSW